MGRAGNVESHAPIIPAVIMPSTAAASEAPTATPAECADELMATQVDSRDSQAEETQPDRSDAEPPTLKVEVEATVTAPSEATDAAADASEPAAEAGAGENEEAAEEAAGDEAAEEAAGEEEE